MVASETKPYNASFVAVLAITIAVLALIGIGSIFFADDVPKPEMDQRNARDARQANMPTQDDEIANPNISNQGKDRAPNIELNNPINTSGTVSAGNSQ